MKVTREQLEAKALELGIPPEDLDDPLCVKYLKAKMAKPKPYRDREPMDANGLVSLSVQVIRR